MSGNTVFQTYDEQTIIKKFTEYIKSNGGDLSKWFIDIIFPPGISREKIKELHNLSHKIIINFNIRYEDAEKVYIHFKQKKIQNNIKFKDENKGTPYTIYIYKLL